MAVGVFVASHHTVHHLLLVPLANKIESIFIIDDQASPKSYSTSKQLHNDCINRRRPPYSQGSVLDSSSILGYCQSGNQQRSGDCCLGSHVSAITRTLPHCGTSSGYVRYSNSARKYQSKTRGPLLHTDTGQAIRSRSGRQARHPRQWNTTAAKYCVDGQ